MERALIQREMHDRLRRCRDKMALNGVPGWDHPRIENLAAVFVPVRPRPEAQVPFTALIVGQATRDYDSAETCFQTFETTTTRNVELVEASIRKPSSPFWGWTRAVLARAYEALGQEVAEDRLLGCLGWSNLAKIGDVKGNPPAWTIAGQAELAVEALHSEMAQMRPTIVIACVGRFGVEAGSTILDGVFEKEEDWNGAKLGYGRVRSSTVPVVFAPHPHMLRLSKQWEPTIDDVSRRVAALASSDWTG